MLPSVSSRQVFLRDEHLACNRSKSIVIWLIGLSGAGKSTIARGFETACVSRSWQSIVIDGDSFRRGVSSDLGFSPSDRRENIRRAAEVAALLAARGVIVICAFICPSRADRQLAREIVNKKAPDADFFEIYLSASLQICESRDCKKLYARARAGEIEEFTGISATFEIPDKPDLVIDTGLLTHENALSRLVTYLVPLISRQRVKQHHVSEDSP